MDTAAYICHEYFIELITFHVSLKFYIVYAFSFFLLEYDFLSD